MLDVKTPLSYKMKKKNYALARRYEFYVLVARTISHLFAALTREIFFLPLKHEIHIFSTPCNIFVVFQNTGDAEVGKKGNLGHLSALIEICVHLISCISGHIWGREG